MHIFILRDPRESAAKCSLTRLRGLSRVEFAPYRVGREVHVGERILLHLDGELLSPDDAGRDLLLLDCAWRRVPALRATIRGRVHARRLPRLQSAYPRRSKTFEDPEVGLASVEALFAACAILGEPRPELLDGYRWRDAFLRANPELAPFARTG